MRLNPAVLTQGVFSSLRFSGDNAPEQKKKRGFRLSRLRPEQAMRDEPKERMFWATPQETALFREAAPLNDTAKYTLGLAQKSSKPLHIIVHGPSDLRETVSFRVLQLFHWIKQQRANANPRKVSLGRHIHEGVRYLRQQLPITAVELDKAIFRRAKQQAFVLSPVDKQNYREFVNSLETDDDKTLFKAIWNKCFRQLKSNRNPKRKILLTKGPLRHNLCELRRGDMLAHAQNKIPTAPIPENVIALIARNAPAYLGLLSNALQQPHLTHVNVFHQYLDAVCTRLLPGGIFLYGESERHDMTRNLEDLKTLMLERGIRPTLPSEIAWHKCFQFNFPLAPYALIKDPR